MCIGLYPVSVCIPGNKGLIAAFPVLTFTVLFIVPCKGGKSPLPFPPVDGDPLHRSVCTSGTYPAACGMFTELEVDSVFVEKPDKLPLLALEKPTPVTHPAGTECQISRCTPRSGPVLPVHSTGVRRRGQHRRQSRKQCSTCRCNRHDEHRPQTQSADTVSGHRSLEGG